MGAELTQPDEDTSEDPPSEEAAAEAAAQRAQYLADEAAACERHSRINSRGWIDNGHMRKRSRRRR